MYHIQKDVRAQKSARLIGEGMQNCLANKKFVEITVSDLQRASSVGRSTFYRLFDNTTDVLSYLCDQIFEQADREYEHLREWTAEETMRCFIRIWMEHRTLLKAIVDAGQTEILCRAHRKYLTKNDLFFPGIETMDEVQVEYLMSALTACTAAFLSAWVRNGGKETAEQLQEHLKVCFRMMGNIYPDG